MFGEEAFISQKCYFSGVDGFLLFLLVPRFYNEIQRFVANRHIRNS